MAANASTRIGQVQQLSLGLPRQTRATRSWGGRRKGAGRKSTTGQRGMSHLARPELDARLPLHVTLRMAQRVWSLRSQRGMSRVEASLRGGAHRFGVRVVQVSVQGNHIHCLVEAPDKASLASAMKGLGVRLARRMNALMASRGRVLADRYHARALRTPTEVKNAIHYIRHNHRHHHADLRLPIAWLDPCSSDTRDFALPTPSTWLLRVGWRRGRVSQKSIARVHLESTTTAPRS